MSFITKGLQNRNRHLMKTPPRRCTGLRSLLTSKSVCAHGQGWQGNLAHCREKERLVDRDQRLKELDDKYEDYTIYDNVGEKIGKVDDVFIDETDREEYIGVKMGLFGLSGTTLIPMEI